MRNASADSHALIWGMLQAHKGKGHAITQYALASETGIHPRAVRAIIKGLIENERRLICSSYKGGYFLPETQAEIEATLGLLRSHAISILKRCQALGVDINKLQMELFGGQS